jgi:hypothetical protein
MSAVPSTGALPTLAVESAQDAGVWGGMSEDERLAISGCSLPAGGAHQGRDWAGVFAKPRGPGSVPPIGDVMGYGGTAAWFRRELRLAGVSGAGSPALGRGV